MLRAPYSQEVVRRAASDVRLAPPRRGVEHEVVIVHLLVHFHYSSLVAASVAVVWRRKDRHNLVLVRPVVPLKELVKLIVKTYIHNQLMGPCDCLEAVLLDELFRDVLAKRVASASGRDAPSRAVVRV